MKKLPLTLAAGLLLSAFISSCNTADSAPAAAAAPSKDSLIRKGASLVTTMGCNDCHSPKRMGPQGPELIPELLLSGRPADQPLPAIPKDTAARNWMLFAGDLTAIVGP